MEKIEGLAGCCTTVFIIIIITMWSEYFCHSLHFHITILFYSTLILSIVYSVFSVQYSVLYYSLFIGIVFSVVCVCVCVCEEVVVASSAVTSPYFVFTYLLVSSLFFSDGLSGSGFSGIY